MACYHIQSKILWKIFGYVPNGFFGDFISLAGNIVKHSVRKYINGFLELIAQVIKIFDILQGHKKLVVDL